MNDSSNTPITLAKHIRSTHPEWSWNECRNVIKSARVTVNNETITDDTFRVPDNSVVEIHARPQLQSSSKSKNETSLHVYHYDQHIIVIEKPSGIESVPFETKKKFEGRFHAQTSDTLIDMARKWLEQNERQKLPPLKVVHRLDKGTSGIIVFARTVTAERHLGKLFREHDIKRSYIAFCPGVPKSETIRSRLVENRGDGKRGSTKNKTLGKEAITHVNRLQTRKTPKGSIISMVACQLETGRTHQIRIHLSEAGHPLCGETVYNGPMGDKKLLLEGFGIPRIGLHARELGFMHPVTNQVIYWESPLPKDLQDWWETAKDSTF